MHSVSKTISPVHFEQADIISPLLTVKGYARLPVHATGQRVDADAVIVVALRRGHGGSDGGEGLSSRDLCGSVFVFDVPKGRSPGLRDGP